MPHSIAARAFRSLGLALSLGLPSASASASGGYWYGMMGGWAYQARGSVTNGQQLDFQRDLGLHSTDRGDLALGFAPARQQSHWIPTVDLSYIHIGERGLQLTAVNHGRPDRRRKSHRQTCKGFAG